MKTVGIDIRRPDSPRHGRFCLLGRDGIARFGEARGFTALAAVLRELKPAAVAVGAPLKLRPGAKIGTRSAELQLRRLQHPLCRNPYFAPLPSAMIPSLAKRGAALRRRLRAAAGSFPLLETHPPSAWEFLGLAGGLDRFRAASQNPAILSPFGVGSDAVLAATSPPRLDSLLCALTARLHLEGRTVSFGEDADEKIHLPRPAWIGLVALDVDGTLTEVRSPWRHVHEQLGLWDGAGERILGRWLSGEINYDSFCALDVGLWNEAGVSLEKVCRILDSIAVRPRAVGLLQRLAARGIDVAMVSSGFRRVAERIALAGGVAGKVEIIANELRRTARGTIGARVRVSGDRGGGRSKGRHLRRLLSGFGVSPVNALAVGDGPSDAGMFERCGQRVLVAEAQDLDKVESLLRRCASG